MQKETLSEPSLICLTLGTETTMYPLSGEFHGLEENHVTYINKYYHK